MKVSPLHHSHRAHPRTPFSVTTRFTGSKKSEKLRVVVVVFVRNPSITTVFFLCLNKHYSLSTSKCDRQSQR